MNVFGCIHLVCAKQSQIVPHIYRKKIEKMLQQRPQFCWKLFMSGKSGSLE